VPFDPDDVRCPGSEFGHELEDLELVVLAWSGSGVAGPSDGAGRIRVPFNNHNWESIAPKRSYEEVDDPVEMEVCGKEC